MPDTPTTGSLEYLIGDATAPGPGPCVIAHVANDNGGWGRGFVLAISRRWSEPERAYRLLARTGLILGTIQIVDVAPGLSVANMVAQHGYASAARPVPLDYVALSRCLAALHAQAPLDALIAMPRIGAGLGGGAWDRIELLIKTELVVHGRRVRVYDLPRK